MQRSTSSGGGDMSPGSAQLSLDERYRKLVEAYKKIKQQNGLLKQAVVQGREMIQQEKAKEEEQVASLHEVEKKLRSSEEANDLLRFDNNRLAKKVEAIQRQFQEKQAVPEQGYGWFGSGAKQELLEKKQELQVAINELGLKIRENEQLHIKIFEDKKEAQQTIELLEQKMKALKHSLQQQKDTLMDQQNQHGQALLSVTAEKDENKARAAQLEENLTRTQNLMKEREAAMTLVQAKLDEDLNSAMQLIKQKISFDDTSNTTFNRLNSAPYDRKRELKKLELATVGLEHFRGLISHFSDYFSAFHEGLLLRNKSTTISDSLRNINRKIILVIPSHAKYLTAVHRAMADLLAEFTKSKSPALDAEKSRAVINAMQKFVLFNKKLLTYEVLRLETETKQQTTEEGIRARNGMLCESLYSFHATLEKLSNYVIMAVSPEGSEHKVSRYNHVFILKQILVSLSTMNDVLKTFNSQLSSKILLEHKDPFMLPALKQVNERILINQNAIVTFSSKLVIAFDAYYTLAASPPAYPVRGAKVAPQAGVSTLEKRGRDYLGLVNKMKIGESIPYAESIANKKSVSENEEKNRRLQEEIRVLKEQKEALARDKSRSQAELASVKDALAAKNAHHNSLLAELAQARQQLERVSKQTPILTPTSAGLPQQQPIGTSNMVASPPTPSLLSSLYTNGSTTPALDFASISSTPTMTPPVSVGSGGTDLLMDADMGMPGTVNTHTDNHISSATSTPDNKDSVPSTPDITRKSLLLSFDDDEHENIYYSPVDQFGPGPISEVEIGGANLGGMSLIDMPLEEMRQTDISELTHRASEKQKDAASAHSFTDNDEEEDERERRKREGNFSYNLIVMDETGAQSNSFNLREEDREREAELKRFYDRKVENLMTQLKEADKKAVKFHKEYTKAVNQLDKTEEEKVALQAKLAAAEQQVRKTREELELTRQNYEQQMNLLSEHLATLNDKIIKQEDTIISMRKQASSGFPAATVAPSASGGRRK